MELRERAFFSLSREREMGGGGGGGGGGGKVERGGLKYQLQVGDS